jgi:leucine dehydrogenase
MYTIVAVHSTARGPSLGGCRMWNYGDSRAAVRDALRLSRAMTFKSAVAGLPLGGGKGVIMLPAGHAPPEGERRREVLSDFGETVDALDRAYITAEDVGTSDRDMAVIAEVTAHVAGLAVESGSSGDPSPWTALGVKCAMEVACERAFGSPSLAGRSVSVVGLGRVGGKLARMLAEDGAALTVADVDESKRTLAEDLGAGWTDPATALTADVDIVAPCALGGIINISVELEPEGYDASRAEARVRGVADTTRAVFEQADATGATPLAAAVEIARRRLAEAAAGTAAPLP